MSINFVPTPSSGVGLVDRFNAEKTLEEIKTAGAEGLKAGIEVVKGIGKVGAATVSHLGGILSLPSLASPKYGSSVTDITLKIGLLQDALNQLMAQVSKLGIEKSVNEKIQANLDQLEALKENLKQSDEYAAKQAESKKKANIGDAISNWVQAVVNIVSAAFNVVAAVGMFFSGNMVAVAALVTSAVCLVGAAACNITLAIDATMKAGGGEGFLSEKQIGQLNIAVTVLGVIAAVAGLIGVVGGLTTALGNAAKESVKAVGKEAVAATTKEVLKEAAEQAVKETVTNLTKSVGKESLEELTKTAVTKGMKEMSTTLMKETAKKGGELTAKEVTQAAVKSIAVNVYKAAMQEFTTLAARQAVLQLVVQVPTAIIKYEFAKGKNEADQGADTAKTAADAAAASVAAMKATIDRLTALIEQLQQSLSDMMDEGQQTMSMILSSLTKTMDSTKLIIETATA